jgi:hypothetical protein
LYRIVAAEDDILESRFEIPIVWFLALAFSARASTNSSPDGPRFIILDADCRLIRRKFRNAARERTED